MPLMSWAIQLACQNAYSNHTDACNHALEAGSKQIGLFQTDEKVENYYTLQAKETATSTFGTGATDIVGGTAYFYKVYRNKAIDFKLPTLGLADSASNHITTNSYSINLSWKMPWLK